MLTAMRVFPKEGFNLEEIIENLKKIKGCNTAKIEDYVFGAKIIKASFICEDGEGIDFEEIVKKVAGVNEVNVDKVGLIS